MTHSSQPKKCAISGVPLSPKDAVPCRALRPSLLSFIRHQHPTVGDDDIIDGRLLPSLKAAYVEEALSEEIGEITTLERGVIESLRQHEILSTNPDDEEANAVRTTGERAADQIATFGGSWTFILSFFGFLFVWIAVNTTWWTTSPEDPYPFILLNLILSCTAAVQAPIIMMSQHRQEFRDRRRAEQDYQINLKAELEIRHLHEKLDHLLHHHSERLLEIQQIQTEMLRELMGRERT